MNRLQQLGQQRQQLQTALGAVEAALYKAVREEMASADANVSLISRESGLSRMTLYRLKNGTTQKGGT